jgi:hypothetical protein
MLHKQTGVSLLSAINPSFSMYTTPIGVALKERGKYYTTNAIIDSGASTTLMSQQLAKELGVTGVNVPLQLTAINGECCTIAVQAKVAIRNAQTNETMGLIDVKIVPSFPEITAVDWTDIKNNFSHLKDITPPKPVNNGECHLLLGNNNGHLTGSLDSDIMVLGMADLPIAKSTKLGITIGGRTTPRPSDTILCTTHNAAVQEESERISQELHQAQQTSD